MRSVERPFLYWYFILVVFERIEYVGDTLLHPTNALCAAACWPLLHFNCFGYLFIHKNTMKFVPVRNKKKGMWIDTFHLSTKPKNSQWRISSHYHHHHHQYDSNYTTRPFDMHNIFSIVKNSFWINKQFSITQ